MRLHVSMRRVLSAPDVVTKHVVSEPADRIDDGVDDRVPRRRAPASDAISPPAKTRPPALERLPAHSGIDLHERGPGRRSDRRPWSRTALAAAACISTRRRTAAPATAAPAMPATELPPAPASGFPPAPAIAAPPTPLAAPLPPSAPAPPVPPPLPPVAVAPLPELPVAPATGLPPVPPVLSVPPAPPAPPARLGPAPVGGDDSEHAARVRETPTKTPQTRSTRRKVIVSKLVVRSEPIRPRQDTTRRDSMSRFGCQRSYLLQLTVRSV